MSIDATLHALGRGPVAIAVARLLAALTAAGFAVCVLAADARGRDGYWASATCRGCHARIYEQHQASHHERSFTNPVFQAQYFEELLPRARRDAALAEEARRCTACHAPVQYSVSRQALSSANLLDPAMSGVTCDLCHTIRGYAGREPGDGNFISSPTQRKLGPFASDASWHREYSPLHARSELCATCHEARNHHGVAVKTTYSEWKRSAFATKGIHCQDCHMTRDGFLVGGKPRFDSGKSAGGAALIDPPDRDRLYTHRFAGAHSRSQVEGALTLKVELSAPQPERGGRARVAVTVDNARTGHRMPSGSADLRLLWLEVGARLGDRVIALPATAKARAATYAIAGRGAEDAAVLGDDVPAGSRVYRAVFAGADGRQTLSSYDAVGIVHDNRLEAGERRVELYAFDVPADAPERIRVEARLRYLSYPTAFTRRMNLPAAEPVDVASASAELLLSGPRPRPDEVAVR